MKQTLVNIRQKIEQVYESMLGRILIPPVLLLLHVGLFALLFPLIDRFALIITIFPIVLVAIRYGPLASLTPTIVLASLNLILMAYFADVYSAVNIISAHVVLFIFGLLMGVSASNNRKLRDTLAQQKRDRDNLQANEQFLLDLLQRSGESILHVNPNWLITFVNNKTESLLKHPKPDILAKSIFDFIPPRFHESLRQEMEIFIQTRLDQDATFTPEPLFVSLLDASHIEIPTEITLSAVETETGIILLMVIRTIERSSISQQLQSIRQQLIYDLTGSNSMQAGAETIVEAFQQLPGVDAVSVYRWVDSPPRYDRLQTTGFSQLFQAATATIRPSDSLYELIEAGKAVYHVGLKTFAANESNHWQLEGLHAYGLIPVLDSDDRIALILVASRTEGEIPFITQDLIADLLPHLSRSMAQIDLLITRRQKLETLTQQVAFNRLVFDEVPSGIIIRNSQGEVILYNEVANRTLGISEHDTKALISITNKRTIIREDRTPYTQEQLPSSIALQTGKTQPQTRIGIIQDHTETWLDVSTTLLDADNPIAPNGVLVIFEDKTSEHRQKDASYLAQTALTTLPQPVVVLSAEGTIDMVNDVFCDLCGYSRDDLLNRNLEILYSEETAPEFYDKMWRDLRAGQHWQGQTDLMQSDGKRIPVQMSMTPVQDATDKLTHIIGLMIDHREQAERERREQAYRIELEEMAETASLELITVTQRMQREIAERIRIEDGLRKSEETFREVIGQSIDGIVLVNKDETILEWNAMMESFTGLPREDVIGQELSTLPMFANTNTTALNTDKRHETTGGNTPMEATLSHVTGSQIHTQMTMYPIRLHDNILYGIIFRDMTEVRAAVDNMRDAERRYRALFESGTDAVFIIDLEGNHLSMSARAAKLMGYQPHELIGQPAIASGVATAEQSNAAQRMVDLLEHGQVPIYECIFRRKDGSRFTGEVLLTLVRDDLGEPLYIQSVIRDVTERIESQQALERSEARATALLNAVPDMIWQVRKDGIMLDYRAAADEFTRNAERDLHGLHLREFLGDDLAATVSHHMYEALTTGEVVSFEAEYPMDDGPTRYYEMRFSRNNPDEVTVIVRNITEQKESAALLVESEVRFRSAFEQAAVGMAQYHFQGQLLRANDRFYQILGYEDNEPVSDMSLLNLIAAPYQDKASDKLTDITDGQKTHWIDELQMLTATGKQVWVQLTINRIDNPLQNQPYITVIIEDIQRRKHAEESLAEAYARHRELDRLKDDFVASISHELRAPLTNLRLYHDLIKMKPDRIDGYLDTLSRETERLEVIINDLLWVSRKNQEERTITPTAINMGQLIEDYVHDYHALAEQKDVTLTADIPDIPLMIHADRVMLGRALSILLDNALNFTPASGTVRLVATQKLVDDRYRINLTVTDTGPGVSRLDANYIFERFYRGEAALMTNIPGTGLGLSIAREILDLHEGGIDLLNPGDEGASFAIWLPLHTTQQTGEPS